VLSIIVCLEPGDPYVLLTFRPFFSGWEEQVWDGETLAALQRRLEDYVDDDLRLLFPELPVPLTLVGVILEHVPKTPNTLAVLTMSLWRSWDLRFIAVLSCVCITPFVPPIRSGSFVPGRHSRIGAPRGNRHTHPWKKKIHSTSFDYRHTAIGKKKSCYLIEPSP